NIYYDADTIASSASKQTIRLGLVQWQMRTFNDIEAFYDQVEFFVDAVSGYNADFAVFPEFFNTPLMGPFNHLPEREAMQKLAEMTEEIRDRIQTYAVSYNVNIISGSMPLVENGKLYNVSYLCHRNGSYDEYRKVHITRNDVKYYGMYEGYMVTVIDIEDGKDCTLCC